MSLTPKESVDSGSTEEGREGGADEGTKQHWSWWGFSASPKSAGKELREYLNDKYDDEDKYDDV